MYIPDFNYHKPKTLKEACSLLEKSEDAAPIAGGTDILVEIKQGLRHHNDIVSLADIKELKSIDQDTENLYIGATVTHNDVSGYHVVKESFPAIAEAALKIGTEQIRNTGTIGGNLCTGASCCDMGPVLIALDAKVEIVNSSKVRTVSLKDFFIFHKDTSLKKGEIMTRIIVPLPKPNPQGFENPEGLTFSEGLVLTGTCFEKFGLREAASISVASVAVMIKLDGDTCTDACVVTGAVAPTPKISNKANGIITGRKISELSQGSPILKQAGEAAAEDSLPVDDIRGSAQYRRNLIKILTQRAVIKAIERAKISGH
ncbi:MAG: xanthine dehydrogenase family protein subunit M [Bacteroidota bacterium]